MNKTRGFLVIACISFLIMSVTFSIPAFCESFRIIYISSPASIICGNERKTVGDTISSHDQVIWSGRNQAMKAQCLEDGQYKGKIFIFQKFPSDRVKNMKLLDYAKSSYPLAGRGDIPQTAEALRAVIPDTLFLLDKIEIPTNIIQDPSHFFFIEYDLNGEIIRKKLKCTDGELTIDRDIYVIDGKAINPIEVAINIFYYNETTRLITIIGENKIIVPLDL